MTETEHQSFFRTHKVLAFLPLALISAGVLFYVHEQTAKEQPSSTSAPATPAAFAAKAGPERPHAAAATAPKQPLRKDANDPDSGLDIQGSFEFQNQVTQALKLIWLSDRDTFLFIKKNLYIIRNDNKTGFYRENGVPAASISSDQAFRSLTWCAGVIAHQAWHASVSRGVRKTAGRVPPPPGEQAEDNREINPMKFDYKDLNAILASEDMAFAFQLQVLRGTKAPKKEINLVLRREPRDFSAGHDGSYSLNP